MKKILILFAVFAIVSCGPGKVAEEKRPLYEMLIQKTNGGAKVRFFEIISLPEEFAMIKNDPELKGKIKPNDINTASFLILSAGEKNTGGYGIEIESVEETDKNIIVTVRETKPKPRALHRASSS